MQINYVHNLILYII